MTNPINTGEPATRAEIYRIVADAIDSGLPAPKEVWFNSNGSSFTIHLDSVADRIAWQPIFGLQDAEASEQPYPEAEPFDQWITNVYGTWRGWWMNLHGADPITDELLDRWAASGDDARRAAYRARRAAEGGERS
jgi:hypothetical protein